MNTFDWLAVMWTVGTLLALWGYAWLADMRDARRNRIIDAEWENFAETMRRLGNQ